MREWLYKTEDKKKSDHAHDWEVLVKEKIYPSRKKDSFMPLYETRSWTFDEKLLKMLNDKGITKEEIIAYLEKLSNGKKEEEHPIGIYMLLKCKCCGELKEIKNKFDNEF